MSKYGVVSGTYFSIFGMNKDIYSVNLGIQSEYRKVRTRNKFVFGHFSKTVTAIWNIEKFGEEFRDSHTTSRRTNHEKIKIYKALIKLRFVKINPRGKSRGSLFAKLNPREMLKKRLAKTSLRKNLYPKGYF